MYLGLLLMEYTGVTVTRRVLVGDLSLAQQSRTLLYSAIGATRSGVQRSCKTRDKVCNGKIALYMGLDRGISVTPSPPLNRIPGMEREIRLDKNDSRVWKPMLEQGDKRPH
jgi:hypothetical protein